MIVVRSPRAAPCAQRWKTSRRFSACAPINWHSRTCDLYAYGLRHEELVSLRIRDFNAGALRVLGKSNAERGVLLALQRWLGVNLANDKDAPPFVLINKHSKFADRPLTTQAVYDMVVRRCTLVSNLFDAGVAMATIADIVGHVSIEMTRKYDRRPEQVRRGRVIVAVYVV